MYSLNKCKHFSEVTYVGPVSSSKLRVFLSKGVGRDGVPRPAEQVELFQPLDKSCEADGLSRGRHDWGTLCFTGLNEVIQQVLDC